RRPVPGATPPQRRSSPTWRPSPRPRPAWSVLSRRWRRPGSGRPRPARWWPSTARAARPSAAARARAAAARGAAGGGAGAGAGSGGSSGSGSGGGSGSGSGSGSSSAFIELVQQVPVKVTAYFDEADAVKVRVGQPAVVTFDALPGRTATGVVTSVDTSATV